MLGCLLNHLSPYSQSNPIGLKSIDTVIYRYFEGYRYRFKQCCGTGMFYPGSGSLTFFLSRIPDPGGEKEPDLGSRILMYIKIGMKNKTNFVLAFYCFRSKFYW
jgi:hypothetical protein